METSAKNQFKIFVSAYACEPGLGSESGVGWHWVEEMSKYFEVWVLTRKSNEPAVSQWLVNNPACSHIHFLYFDLPKWVRFWKKGLRGVHLYYYLWQLSSDSVVKRTMRENEIEIFHHLTYGNILWNVSSYGQKHCFIWGPVGGLETVPVEYSRNYNCKARFKEWIRRRYISYVKWNIAFRRRCDNASLILCKTDITRRNISPYNQIKARLFTDVAMEKYDICHRTPATGDPIEYLMVGRLDAWRGFDIAIESFARASQEYPNIHLNIVGKGEDKKRLQSLIRNLKMENRITLCGEVSKPVYEAMLADTDVVINASLKEAAVTLSFDSVACEKPLICLDTTGHTRLLEGCGAVIIPLCKREKVIEDLTDAILQLTNNKERFELAMQSRKNNRRLTWEERGKIVRGVINRTYAEYCLGKLSDGR